MTFCAVCNAENRQGARFCHACGAALPPPLAEAAVGRDNIRPGELAPGTLLQGRYEIVGLLGHQADTALYRAYDLRRCWNCGAALSEGESFCPICGAEAGWRGASCRVHEQLLIESVGNDGQMEAGKHSGALAWFADGGYLYVVLPEPVARESQMMVLPHGMRLAIGFRSESGPVREVNQDSLLMLTFQPVYEGQPSPTLGLYAVADGIGGHDDGEVASRLTMQILAEETIRRLVMPELGGESCMEETLSAMLTEAVENVNAQLYAIQQSRGVDLGSTLTAVLIRNTLALIANVGDSRTYLWRNGTLTQITTDHSVVARLVASGEAKPEEISAHPQKGVIYRSLGDKPSVEVDIFAQPLQPGDRVLLCCDGVWESLGDEGIEEVLLAEADPQRACDEFIRRAELAGVEDNMSVIVVSVPSP